ncbi:MAG: oligosaccharide flippase family protein, partial [Weeksellaceae bacterium]
LYWIRGGYIPTGEIKMYKIKYHFNFGYKLLLSGLLNTIHVNLYAPLIGKYYSPTQVGYFSRAHSFSSVPINLLTSIFSKVTFPVLAEVQHNEEKFILNFRKILKLILFVVSPIMCLLFITTSSLIELLLTARWLSMAPYFKWFAICGIFLPLHLYYLNVLKIKGRSELFLKAEIIKVSFGILILIITVQMGLMFIVYGILLSNIISLFINQYFCRDVINYSFISQWTDIITILLPAVLSLIITLQVKPFYINTYNILEITYSTVIYIYSYLSFNFLLNLRFLREIKKLLYNMRNVIQNKHV